MKKIEYYLSQVWPYIKRFLDFTFFEIFRIIKGFFKYAAKQIGF